VLRKEIQQTMETAVDYENIVSNCETARRFTRFKSFTIFRTYSEDFFDFIQRMTREKVTYEEKEETSLLRKIRDTQAVQTLV
jgi:hypothetical protein